MKRTAKLIKFVHRVMHKDNALANRPMSSPRRLLACVYITRKYRKLSN